MHHEVIVAWLAGLFGLMAVTLALAAALVSWPVLLVAAPLGATAVLLWYHASGRLRERMERQAYRRRVERQRHDSRGAPGTGVGPGPTGTGRAATGRARGAAAAGPTATDGGRRAAPGGFGASAGRRRERRAAGQSRGARRAGTAAAARQRGMSRRRALSVLGLEPGADDADVRAAYRSRVKETHPDRGGDADAFMRVTEAYERLDGSS